MKQPSCDRTENIVGALALALSDRVQEELAAAGGASQTSPAALSSLLFLVQAPTIEQLGQVVGLTSSGTVRLVDRLSHEGLVKRGPGVDGRTTAISLTAAGQQAAGQVAAARSRVLVNALSALTDRERVQFRELAAKVLAGLVRGPGATRWICRLCDTQACERDAGKCPVANEVETRRRAS